MVEIGAIDCGSNSTRLLISTVENGKLENLHKEHQVTRLSDNIDKTGTISDDSKKRFFKVLRKYMRKIEEYKVQEVFCIGTAVFRNSKNSDEVIDEVKKRFNLEIKMISGEEEGLLTSLGVQSSFENLENYFIVDIGGQSTELITDIDNKLDIQSEDIGVVSMSENYFNENPINIDKEETAINFFNDNLGPATFISLSLLVSSINFSKSFLLCSKFRYFLAWFIISLRSEYSFDFVANRFLSIFPEDSSPSRFLCFNINSSTFFDGIIYIFFQFLQLFFLLAQLLLK